MNNQVVAAPCCGSCEHCSFSENARTVVCNKLKDDYGGVTIAALDGFCRKEFYTPRNPIPIIELPGVKEMVKEAYMEGFEDRWIKPEGHIGLMAKEYLKALEAK